MLSHVIAGLLGYLLGSVPTAYLLVRWKSQVDIRKVGSGNVGTLNSFEVTDSRLVGLSVLVLDLLKGVAAVFCVKTIVGPEFEHIALAGVSAVLGHNFPVWLGLRGGRGLATAAGVMLSISWVFVLIWGICWVVVFKVSNAVNVGNAAACVVTLACILVLPGSVLTQFMGTQGSTQQFTGFAVILFATILVRHVDPIKEFIQEKKRSIRK